MDPTLSPASLLGGCVLLIDKPLGWTSFDAVNKLRWKICRSAGIKKLKVGHAGTLDPLATGLLIICTGKFTTRLEEFQAQEKIYTGVIELGAETPSYDLETEIHKRSPIDAITKEQIEQARRQFLGEIEQLPPIFSAVKQDGKRLYKLARAGQEVERKPRSIRIDRFELDTSGMPDIAFELACSKGTYVRSLAHDLGAALGCGAYLKRLRRTANGAFSVADAWEMEPLLAAIDALDWAAPRD